MARLHRRYLKLEWDRHLASFGWLYTLGVVAKFPLRALRDARRGVQQYGAAAESHGVSRGRQLVEQWRLRLRYGLMPEAYYRFRLFLPERRPYAGAYIGPEVYLRVLNHLLDHTPGPARRTLRDKRLFMTWCEANGIPTTTELAQFAEGALVGPEPTLPPADLFSKPSNAGGGKGARLWRYQGERRWSSATHEGADAGELLQALREQSREWPVILQLCLHNHPAVVSLSAGGVNTIRMVTHRDLAGNLSLLLAVYRMTAGGGAVDNFDAGGLAAPVDPESGRLGAAVQKSPRDCTAYHERHPDTGAPITGAVLPLWAEARALVERAHRLLPEIDIVGWDVALTPDGPAIIEGNAQPGCLLSQMPSGVPFGRSGYAAILEELLRRRVDGRVPS